jgi:hypothetical protein
MPNDLIPVIQARTRGLMPRAYAISAISAFLGALTLASAVATGG